MFPFVDHKALSPHICHFSGKYSTKQTCPNYQIIILIHIKRDFYSFIIEINKHNDKTTIRLIYHTKKFIYVF